MLTQTAPDSKHGIAFVAPNTLIAFQGEFGAFGHEAVQLLRHGAHAVPMPTFAAVVAALRQGKVSYGVLPVENTIIGPIAESCGVIVAADDVDVVGEVSVPVRLCVLGVPGATIDQVTMLVSQDVALAQIRVFLRAHPGITTQTAHDTAGAAKLVASRGDPSIAAVASSRAARQYGLSVLAAGIEDVAGNATRFAVIALRDRH
ncbi:MAG TPA: prephenate dehydratase domain-containing protein [Gemmatimonadaceae bacterium]|nr:prephenate dehydratase domain-containing protein [Gemmatimonadaceae bacterium]